MIAIVLVLLLFDIVSKVLVSNYVLHGTSISLINNVFYITYVKNTGAAWSLFDDSQFFVMLISGIIIFAIIVYIIKNGPYSFAEKLAYSLIVGGAIGNFINRLFLGYVIDFIGIIIFGYEYPIFNLADVFIVFGVLILVIYTWRCKRNDDSSR